MDAYVRVPLNAAEAKAAVVDSALVTRTYLGLDDNDGNVVVVEVEGPAPLEALARMLLERAACMRRDEVKLIRN